MKILLNGQTLETVDSITLAELIATLDLHTKRIAVEVNLEIIPKSLHANHVLQPEDRVEIVHALGGG